MSRSRYSISHLAINTKLSSQPSRKKNNQKPIQITPNDSLSQFIASLPIQDICYKDFQGKKPVPQQTHTLLLARLDALKEGADLLLEEVSNVTSGLLKSQQELSESYQECVDEITNDSEMTPHEGKKVLKQFLKKACVILKLSSTALSAKKDRYVVKQLFKAENYSTWSKIRKPIVSISEISSSQGPVRTIVQVETPACKWTQTQINEFLDILTHPVTHLAWFARLAEWEKNYLKRIAKKVKNGEDINILLSTLPTTLRTVIGLANFYHHDIYIYEGDKLTLSSSRSRSGIVTPFGIMNMGSSEDIQHECQLITKHNIMQLIMKEVPEQFSRHVAKIKMNDEDDIVEIPVLLQTLLTANTIAELASLVGIGDHDPLMVSHKNQAAQELQNLFAKAQSKNLTAHESMILEYLGIDPSGYIPVTVGAKQYRLKPNFIATNQVASEYRKFGTSDERVDSEMMMVCENFLSLLLPSHTISFAMSQFFSKDFDENIWKKLGGANIDTLRLLHFAIHQYCNNEKNSDRHDNLFTSSLEQIIVETCMGVAYGSCKSGKDRKAMEIIHTDAFLVYYDIYKKLPQCNDDADDRGNFVNIFVDLYFAYHHHEVANHNSPGAYGIKDMHGSFIGGILPSDIAEEINRRSENECEISDIFAGTNLMSLSNPLNSMVLILLLGAILAVGTVMTCGAVGIISGGVWGGFLAIGTLIGLSGTSAIAMGLAFFGVTGSLLTFGVDNLVSSIYSSCRSKKNPLQATVAPLTPRYVEQDETSSLSSSVAPVIQSTRSPSPHIHYKK